MKCLYILAVILYSTLTFAQFGTQNLIHEISLSGPRTIQAIDMDDDGDLDILATISFDDNVSWYENLDGFGTFGEQNIVGILEDVRSSFASDIDGDGDMDVLAASSGEDRVVLYRKNANGSFSNAILLTLEEGAFDVKTFDIDNDGDQDVVYISFSGARLQWLENIDGSGNFGPPQLISNNTPAGAHIQGDDIDGDGDIDIVAAIGQLDTAAWYENVDGLGAFSNANIITTNADGIAGVDIADMDGDGDLDVLSASISDLKVAWYENTDGQGTFIGENIITDDAQFSYFVSAVDVDNDGDMDILSNSGETGNDRIFWQENVDGLGNFGPQISFGENIQFCRYIIGADVDNDGDSDVVYSDQNAGIVAWHENFTILGVPQLESSLDFSIVPNPVKDVLQIHSNAIIEEIQIYTTLGFKVYTTNTSGPIFISHIPAGTYVIKVLDSLGGYGIQKFIKR